MSSTYTRSNTLIDKLRSAYDLVSSRYEDALEQEGGQFYAVAQAEKNKFLSMLTTVPGNLLLDVGAGTGRITRPLALRFGYVYAVDISLGMPQTLKSFISDVSNVFPICADAARLPFRREFDVLTCMGVLDYYSPEDIVLLLAEFRRVIKPGGVALVTFQNREASGIENYINQSENELGVPIHVYSPKEASVLCERALLKARQLSCAGLQIQILARLDED